MCNDFFLVGSRIKDGEIGFYLEHESEDLFNELVEKHNNLTATVDMIKYKQCRRLLDDELYKNEY